MMQDELNSGLSAKDFDRLAEFIQGYAGIKMPAAKKVLVEGRLRRRVKAQTSPLRGSNRVRPAPARRCSR